MILDFRRDKTEISPLVINGSEVEIVNCFKFLGIHISDDLGWAANTDHWVRRAQQQLFFLRRLKYFGLSVPVLLTFYRAVIESVLMQSITVWYGSVTLDERKRLARVVRTTGRIIGTRLPTLDAIHERRLMKKAMAIVRDPSHPAHSHFQMMKSGRRYRSLAASSKRTSNSTYPTAVRALNASLSR